jgi:cell fate regulator YaaT (PSP1 superfamily)
MLGIYQICHHLICIIQCLTLFDYYEKMNKESWFSLRPIGPMVRGEDCAFNFRINRRGL